MFFMAVFVQRKTITKFLIITISRNSFILDIVTHWPTHPSNEPSPGEKDIWLLRLSFAKFVPSYPLHITPWLESHDQIKLNSPKIEMKTVRCQETSYSPTGNLVVSGLRIETELSFFSFEYSHSHKKCCLNDESMRQK